MKSKKLLVVTVVMCLALMVAALPLVSACGPEKEKTLKIGITTPSTGKAAEKGSPTPCWGSRAT